MFSKDQYKQIANNSGTISQLIEDLGLRQDSFSDHLKLFEAISQLKAMGVISEPTAKNENTALDEAVLELKNEIRNKN